MSDIWDRKRRYADLSKQLDKLRDMPERVTREDITKAASALLDASHDIDQLVNTQLKGCTCRRMEDDGRTWVVYDPQCQHHRHLQEQARDNEKRFKEAEAKLEDKLRVSLFHSALGIVGRADAPTPEVIADRAMGIVEAAIARLRK